MIDPETLYVAVSQSGETFDTLAAVQEVKRKGGDVIGVVNAPGSTIAGECGSGVYIHAGPELSVTSTKSYTSTVVAFALLALHLGRVRDLGPGDGARLIDGLDALPDHIADRAGRRGGHRGGGPRARGPGVQHVLRRPGRRVTPWRSRARRS